MKDVFLILDSDKEPVWKLTSDFIQWLAKIAIFYLKNLGTFLKQGTDTLPSLNFPKIFVLR